MRPMAVCLTLCALAGCAGLIPFEAGDISDLTPVQLLCVSRDAEGILLTADGGLRASGADLEQALERLAQAAPGRLLLETVDQMIFVDCLPDRKLLTLRGIRPATGLYGARSAVEDPDGLAVYLTHRRSSVTLGDYRGQPLPMLRRGRSGLYLKKEAGR